MPSALAESDRAAAQAGVGLRLLLVALAAALLFHGALLPFTHANTYDAFIHMFFGDHYHRSWFDPWEPRWYTGFSTTSYPPGAHMAIAALMHLVPLRAAYVLVQLFGLLLLTIGVYRFALLWVAPRAAGYAAIGCVLASSVSETVHIFGQLPTILSLGIFLNGLPYVYRWIVLGGWRNCTAAVIFAAATTAAHHVTTIFGGVLFILPLALRALRAHRDLHRAGAAAAGLRRAMPSLRPLGRGVLLGLCMIGAIAATVFPYWHWSITDPITQVPIPHGSRESFIARPELGFIFFLLPWGAALLALPYAIHHTFATRLWPLGLSLLLCLVLGTGGTTPLPRALLRGAFDILTLDRFTFWATILILPFLGLMIDGLLHGRAGDALRRALGRGVRRLVVGGLFAAMTGGAVVAAVLPTMQPTQPLFVDPAPIRQFLAQDEHDRWRYLTLGFGDQFAYLSAMTSAQSVDGNYHSARRLPELTRFSVERLENAKYLGVPGLGSLRQFLENAERYHLKYVFSNDAFYDPLLHFTGWTRLNRLANGVIVWEKPDITPLPLFLPRREIPRLHALLWGVVPPMMLLLAAAVFAASALRRNFATGAREYRPVAPAPDRPVDPRRLRAVAVALGLTVAVCGGTGGAMAVAKAGAVETPEAVVTRYFEHLDLRRFEKAYALLDPTTRPAMEAARLAWRWRGGLLASYGKLTRIKVARQGGSDSLADWSVTLDWLTALDMRRQTLRVRTIRRGARWYVVPMDLRPEQTPVRLQRAGEIAWNVVGRRQPRPETDLHRDRLDRPRIAIDGARLVRRNGRYSVIGQISNADADPAVVSLFSDLLGDGQSLARQAAGRINGHRLLPAESAGFRIDFEGVLSLQGATAGAGFDPALFIAPALSRAPDAASLEARALVTGQDLYRGVALNGVRVNPVGGAPEISGLAVNTGTRRATIARINMLAYDLTGRPVWAEAGFVETNIHPGQSAPFAIRLPARDEIDVIDAVGPDRISINGSGMETDLPVPGAQHGTIRLDPATGYSALRLHVSAMTHDPLF